MKIYDLRVPEGAVQYLVSLLMKQPIGEAGPLFDDLRAQVQAQDAADVQADRTALEKAIRASIASETAPAEEADVARGPE